MATQQLTTKSTVQKKLIQQTKAFSRSFKLFSRRYLHLILRSPKSEWLNNSHPEGMLNG